MVSVPDSLKKVYHVMQLWLQFETSGPPPTSTLAIENLPMRVMEPSEVGELILFQTIFIKLFCACGKK